MSSRKLTIGPSGNRLPEKPNKRWREEANATQTLPCPIRNALQVQAATPEDARRAKAEIPTDPAATAAVMISQLHGGEIDLPDLVAVLRGQAAAVQTGDLAYVEGMLINQAATLQILFMRLTRQAMSNKEIQAFEVSMRLGLRAQNQCRATLETLAAIKNPPVVFAKQANIAHGHQQINNGMPEPVAHVETENRQTELLEHEHGERLDTGTASTTSAGDPVMATVGKVHGA